MKKLCNILMALVSAIKEILINSAVNEFNGSAICGDMVDQLTQINRL